MRKKIPFLPAEPPKQFDRSSVDDLMLHMPQATHLPMQMPVDQLRETLEDNPECTIFPVLKEVIKGYQASAPHLPMHAARRDAATSAAVRFTQQGQPCGRLSAQRMF